MSLFLDRLPHQILEGHNGRVNCLLYPANTSTRYESHHLLSGGVDFTVCLWDIRDGTKLNTFCVHGGEIMQLLVPPDTCNVGYDAEHTTEIELLNCIFLLDADLTLHLLGCWRPFPRTSLT